jgi:hypothetical protein
LLVSFFESDNFEDLCTLAYSLVCSLLGACQRIRMGGVLNNSWRSFIGAFSVRKSSINQVLPIAEAVAEATAVSMCKHDDAC